MDYVRTKFLFLLCLCLFTTHLYALPEVIVRREAVSLRTEIAGDKLGALVEPGQRLTVLNKVGRWYYIKNKAEDVGWIYEEMVDLDLESYQPVNTADLTPQQIFVLSTKKISVGGEIQSYLWSSDGAHLLFLYLTKDGEQVVNITETVISEVAIDTVFSNTLPKLKFLPPLQERFNGQLSLSLDDRKLLVGGPVLNMLFLDEGFEVQRRERIKVRIDDELYGGVAFSPRGDRAAVYNLVKEELNGFVDNLCLISENGLEYEVVLKEPLDWRQPVVWAPDALSFLYGSQGLIYLVDYQLQAREFATGINYALSPDGREVLFSQDEMIYLQPLRAKTAVWKTYGTRPVWHPAGDKFAYDSNGIWIEGIYQPERKRLLPEVSEAVWAPTMDKMICREANDSILQLFLGEVQDVNYLYELDLGRRDGLSDGMLLSVYRPQIGLKDQTIGHNRESWQGFIRVIETRERTALVRQEKMTRIIGRDEVVVLPSMEKLGRLIRVNAEQQSKPRRPL